MDETTSSHLERSGDTSPKSGLGTTEGEGRESREVVALWTPGDPADGVGRGLCFHSGVLCTSFSSLLKDLKSLLRERVLRQL